MVFTQNLQSSENQKFSTNFNFKILNSKRKACEVNEFIFNDFLMICLMIFNDFLMIFNDIS